MDHDRLFKELLTTFFAEFMELFFPRVARELDRASIHFLDKEVFTDVSSGERHEVDLLAKVKLSGHEAFILIHIENQATAKSDFPKRMFQYFALLHGKFGLPIFPIAIFSYEKPLTAAEERYDIALFEQPILSFQFQAIQLNRLNWREFVTKPNPVASALMTKMSFAPEDRPRVKLDCLRMLATLRLDPARTELIGVFMNSYLKLTAAEVNVYNQELQSIEPDVMEFVMQVVNEWTEMGAIALVLRLLRRRVGEMPQTLVEQIERLDGIRIDDFAEAMKDFRSISDVQGWLDRT